MYGNKLAAAIKVNGKVLREFKDTVYVPFGSEYQITLKNLNTTRAVVHVYADGEDQTPNGLVISAGQSIDLERSIRNGNLTEGNCFKFIERTGAVEQHRGIGIEDGLVRVEYQFEQPRPAWTNDIYYGNGIYPQGGILRGQTHDSYSINCSTTSVTTYDSTSVNSAHSVVNDAGITVPGSHSSQSFSTTHVGTLESTVHNLVFKLVGDTGQNLVQRPVTVKHRPKCQTCGKQNRHSAKFCTECGTALEIFA